VVPQPLQSGPHGYPVGGPRAGGAAGALAQVLHHQERGEEVADLLGQLGVAVEVVLEGGTLAAAPAVEELLGQQLDGVAVGAGAVHRLAPGPSDSLGGGGYVRADLRIRLADRLALPGDMPVWLARRLALPSRNPPPTLRPARRRSRPRARRRGSRRPCR